MEPDIAEEVKEKEKAIEELKEEVRKRDAKIIEEKESYKIKEKEFIKKVNGVIATKNKEITDLKESLSSKTGASQGKNDKIDG